MSSRSWIGALWLGIVLLAGLCGPLRAQEEATPDEVIKKTREAAEAMTKSGEAGLEDFNKPNGPWVWKDTYVFVFDCVEGVIVAHPINQKLVGKNVMGLKDSKGNFFFAQLCDASKNPKGGWVEYWWPKPNQTEPSRKVSYMFGVPNSHYQVGAGIYDDKVSVDQLEALLK